MAAEDDGKTEKPTSKRLGEAREKGEITQSVEVRTWASLLCAFILVAWMAGSMCRAIAGVALPLIERPHEIRVDADSLPTLMAGLAIGVLKAMALPFGTIMVVTLVALVGQTKGFLWVPNKLIPDFTKLDPIKGFKRIFSMPQLVELIKQIVKMVLVGSILTATVWPHVREYQNLPELELLGVLAYLHNAVSGLAMTILIVATVLMAADYWYQHMRFTEKMMMSRQELRDENKQSEGDPMVKGKLRSLRAKRARQRMMQAVPGADVVVTNPTHYAVALKYDMDTMPAPMLVAKGADLVAKRIRELADEHDIPIVENPPLARALYATVELDHEVPPEHYKAVAEVIGYVMRLKGKLAQ